MSFQNAIFKTTPSFKFQGPVTTKSDCLSASYQFDCYKDKDGEVILITPFFDVKAGVKKKIIIKDKMKMKINFISL